MKLSPNLGMSYIRSGGNTEKIWLHQFLERQKKKTF